MTDGNAKRLIATLPPDVFGSLEALAEGARFTGNRSAAVAWCVTIGYAVLTDPSVRDRLYPDPSAALAAFVDSHKVGGSAKGR
jgi:hypothetical protein